MPIKYTKNALWMKDFIEAAGHIVPITKIRKIRGYKMKSGFMATTAGNAILHKGMFDISILLVKTKPERQPDGSYLYNKHKKEYIFDILTTLAHELAHIHPSGWDHTLKHYKLEHRIMGEFLKVLRNKKLKITDYYKLSWKDLMDKELEKKETVNE